MGAADDHATDRPVPRPGEERRPPRMERSAAAPSLVLPLFVQGRRLRHPSGGARKSPEAGVGARESPSPAALDLAIRPTLRLLIASCKVGHSGRARSVGPNRESG